MAKTFNDTRIRQFGQGLLNKAKAELEEYVRKDELSQEGGVKTVLLSRSPKTWTVEGGDTNLCQGDLLVIRYNSFARVSFTDDAFFGVGIVNCINQDISRYEVVTFGHLEEIGHLDLGFGGDYDYSSHYLSDFLKSTTANTTYAKKADVGRMLNATLSDMDRFNEFVAGELSQIDNSLVLSDTSVTLRVGDLVTVTRSNGATIAFQIMTSPNQSYLGGILLAFEGYTPYTFTLIKQSAAGTYQIVARKLLSAIRDNTVTLTQAAYDALATKDPNITYYITE